MIGNTWAWPVNGDPHFERFSRFMGGPVGGFLIRRFNFFVNVLLPAGVRRRRLPGPAMEAYREPFRDPASRAPVHVLPGEILKSRAFLQEVAQRVDERHGHTGGAGLPVQILRVLAAGPLIDDRLQLIDRLLKRWRVNRETRHVLASQGYLGALADDACP